MIYRLMLVLAIAAFTLCAAAVSAGEHAQSTTEKKIVIALKTDDFELVETDMSDLAVGDAETIYTDSGQTVDLLRTEDGVEVYIDGELVDMDFDIEIDSDHGEMHHEKVIIIKKKVETD